MVLDNLTLVTTYNELIKIGDFLLAKKIQRILDNNEQIKPTFHNKKEDKSTSHYVVDIDDDEVDKIIDCFLELEAYNVPEDGETTPLASFYASLVDKWDAVKSNFEN